MSQANDDLSRWRLIQCKLNKLFVHDLKNPISALSANLSFLETALAGETEEVRDAVSDSVLAAAMLLLFAENLNNIAMLESEEASPSDEVSLRGFIETCAHTNGKFAKSAGVRLDVDLPPADIDLICQRRYLELAIENLVLSAIRHSPQGGEVTISSTVEGGEVTFSICDHGRAVSDDIVPHLFTRETQSEAKKHAGNRYGRGIGLYAVGLAAKALNAKLKVGTRNGMTEFALILPLKNADSGRTAGSK